MGRTSSIEWTDATWNPLRGCSMVSRGCEHCYAIRQAHRQAGPGGAYEGLTRMTLTGPKWTGRVRQVSHKLEEPLRWQKPRMVFVNSMSDLFHEKVPDLFVDRVFAVMALTRRHTYQILTKRPERMLDYCQSLTWQRLIECANQNVYGGTHTPAYYNLTSIDARTAKSRFVDGEASAFGLMSKPPLPNVWLGVSAEDQKTWNERVPYLLKTPAAVRWVSAEPLLDAIVPVVLAIDWLVVGGESGPGHRPMHTSWVRYLRDECAAARVPFFFKQWGGATPKANGCELDGREHKEWPT